MREWAINCRYFHLLTDGFNGRLQSLSASRCFIFHCLHRLQQRRHVSHHNLLTVQRNTNNVSSSSLATDQPQKITEYSSEQYRQQLNFPLNSGMSRAMTNKKWFIIIISSSNSSSSSSTNEYRISLVLLS